MRKTSRKRKYKMRKIRRILFALLILIVLLVLLIRKEIIETVSNSEIVQNINRQLEDAWGSDEDKAKIEEERWNYVSKYEYNSPQKRTEAEVIRTLIDYSEKYPEFEEIYRNTEMYPENLLEALCNNPEMIDFVKGYNSAEPSGGEGLTKEELVQDVPLLIQWDKRWGYIPYGDDNIALSGCAPTCLSMVSVALTGDDSVTPAIVAKFAEENDYYIIGTGTQWNIMTEGCQEFGIAGEVISLNKDLIYENLQNGNPIICSMSEGEFTTSGHFIVLAGIKDDKIIVNDPNSMVRSCRLWEYEELQNQIKNLWAFKVSKR